MDFLKERSTPLSKSEGEFIKAHCGIYKSRDSSMLCDFYCNKLSRGYSKIKNERDWMTFDGMVSCNIFHSLCVAREFGCMKLMEKVSPNQPASEWTNCIVFQLINSKKTKQTQPVRENRIHLITVSDFYLARSVSSSSLISVRLAFGWCVIWKCYFESRHQSVRHSTHRLI